MKAHGFASPSFERVCPFEDERRFDKGVDAVLVILTVAIGSSLKPAVLSGSSPIQKRPQVGGSSSQILVISNFDAHDYYMTHPKAQALVNFDAHDYYMTHPKGFDR